MSEEELKKSWKYYHEVIKKITNRAKNINSIVKSKLDWKEYRTKENLEDKLEKNRKSGGLLEKKRFIERANEN